MKRRLHAFGGATAFAAAGLFWSATVVSELFGSKADVALVKSLIPYGLLVLIPAVAMATGTGFSLAGSWRSEIVRAKKKRMPVIAGNALVILVPAAFFLAFKAGQGAFDTVFYTVQGAELVAGAVNLGLLGLNMRDGLRLAASRG